MKSQSYSGKIVPRNSVGDSTDVFHGGRCSEFVAMQECKLTLAYILKLNCYWQCSHRCFDQEQSHITRIHECLNDASVMQAFLTSFFQHERRLRITGDQWFNRCLNGGKWLFNELLSALLNKWTTLVEVFPLFWFCRNDVSIDTELSPIALYHTNNAIPEYAMAGQNFYSRNRRYFWNGVHTLWNRDLS